MLTGTFYVKRLFYLNILIFLICQYTPLGPFLYETFTLTQIWNPLQFIGYIFLHANWGHLFSNMIGLVFFGTVVEQILGSRKFILYYLLMGIVAGIVQILFSPVGASAIGASGAIFGLVTMAFMMQPKMKFLFGIPFKIIFYLMIIAEIYGMVQQSDMIGHTAHLVGVLVAITLFIKEFGFNAKRWKKDFLF
jgi:membrane associated rhomboid family serine protease